MENLFATFSKKYLQKTNMSIRFTFEWITDIDGNDVCLMRNIGDHDHCLRPPY